MSITKLVIECIEGYQDTEPIFIKDVKNYVFDKNGNSNNVSVIFNRLKNKGIIKSTYRGDQL